MESPENLKKKTKILANIDEAPRRNQKLLDESSLEAKKVKVYFWIGFYILNMSIFYLFASSYDYTFLMSPFF